MGRGCGIIAGNQTERKVMNDKFDELAKDLGKSITRRRALWRFGAGVLGGLIAVAGLTNRANANPNPNACRHRCYNRCRKVPPAAFQTCYGACLTACLGG